MNRSIRMQAAPCGRRLYSSSFTLRIAFGFFAILVSAAIAVKPAFAQLSSDEFAQALQQVDQSAPGPDVTAYVSDRLEPAEQEYMRGAMNQLPPAMRERFLHTDPTHVSITIYDGATGQAHFNRPEIAGSLRMEPSAPLPGDDIPVGMGEGESVSDVAPEVLKSCGTTPFPGCTSGGGPYRRVFTSPVAAEATCPKGVKRPCSGKYANTTNTGYFISGTVTPACETGFFTSHQDVGYAFLGGYSKTPKATGGIVNAGLIYNYDHLSLHDYDLFLGILNIGKLVYSSTNPPGNGTPGAIPCDQPVSMEFRVAPWVMNLNQRAGCKSSKSVTSPFQLAACGTVAFILERGTGGAGNQFNESAIVWLAPSFSYGGWGIDVTANQGTTAKPITEYFPQAPCGGCIFKWTTAVAQETEDLGDGTIFSAKWANRKIAPYAAKPGFESLVNLGAPVPMTEKLTLCSEYPLRQGVYNAKTAIEDCSVTGPGVTGEAAEIQVSGYTVSGEDDRILLTSKANARAATGSANN